MNEWVVFQKKKIIGQYGEDVAIIIMMTCFLLLDYTVYYFQFYGLLW